MFKNYLYTSLRTIAKNKVYSALNIIGLALGIAACLFIMQYVSYENSYDTFHKEYENLYRVRYQGFKNNELMIDCAAAVPRAAPFMKEKMPEVVAYARAFPISGVMTYENQKFREERIHIVDPDFLTIFTFPLLDGDASKALNEPNAVVISETAAKKYFGNEDPIGKTINFDGRDDLGITGVAKDVPHNSHIKFDFLISYETLNNRTRNEDGDASSETSWGWYDFNSYVLLQPGTDVSAFNARFAEALYQERGEDFEKDNYRSAFPLQPITRIHLYSNLLQESEPEEQGDGQAVFFLSIVAFFILLIAWINYVNLSTARSIERAKEVGVRKAVGANKRQLVFQFLTESFILNFLATVLAFIIVVVGIRYFNQLTSSNLSLAFLQDSMFWLTFTGIFVLGSLIAGAYPAFVLSSFQPVTSLKGVLSANRFGNQLRRVLVVFQFVASIGLIAGTIIVYQQLNHMRNADVGFRMTETLVVKGPEVFGVDSLFESALQAYKNDMLSKSTIEEMTISSNVPGDEIFWTNGIKRAEEGDETGKIIYIAGVDYDYFPTYDIEIIAGRNYERSFSTDEKGLILNEAATKYLNFNSPESAINQRLTFWGEERPIIGVVSNYNQMSVKAAVSPMVFPLINRGGYFTLKLASDNYQATLSEVEQKYGQFFPGNPFDYFFLDEFYNRQYHNEQKLSRVFTLFSLFAIIVACLGLFGLSSFTALKRTKEIGIRKILGADVKNIIYLLSREFMVLVLVANMIAWPLIYFVMDGWLNNFATRIDVSILVLLLAGGMVVLITLLTVAYKTIEAARSNPIQALRYE